MTQIALEPVTSHPIFRLHLARFAIVEVGIRSLRRLETWRLRHKASCQSARLQARTLRDLGISESQRFIEVNKPFWED